MSTRVEFHATGGTLNNALVGNAALTIYGWIYVWNSDLVAQGTYTLTSVAFDTAGNSTTSAPITIKVDRTPPTVAIAVPSTNGTTVGASVNVGRGRGRQRRCHAAWSSGRRAARSTTP